MTSRYEVTLNDKKLSSVNKNLLILDVAYSTSESFERVSHNVKRIPQIRPDLCVFHLNTFMKAEKNCKPLRSAVHSGIKQQDFLPDTV